MEVGGDLEAFVFDGCRGVLSADEVSPRVAALGLVALRAIIR